MIRRRPSKAEVAAALRHYELLRVEPEPPPKKRAAGDPREVENAAATAGGNDSSTEREQVRQALAKAKLLYHAAVLAVLAGLPFAVEQVADALAAFNAAREALALLEEGER